MAYRPVLQISPYRQEVEAFPLILGEEVVLLVSFHLEAEAGAVLLVSFHLEEAAVDPLVSFHQEGVEAAAYLMLLEEVEDLLV